MGLVKVYNGTLKSGFSGADTFCNLKGCYRLNVELSGSEKLVSKAEAQVFTATSYFSVCGHRGRIPYSAPLCIDPVYGVCYGVTGCPVLKSYSKKSSRLSLFMSYELEGTEVFVQSLPVRGIREMCTLKALCYNVVVAGRNDTDGLLDLCGTTVQAPAMGVICTSPDVYNNTVCTSNTVKTVVCPATSLNGVKVAHTSILLSKYSKIFGGWGQGVQYQIRPDEDASGGRSAALYTGTLSKGSFGTDAFCLPVGKCFIFTIDEDPKDPFGFNYNLWIMCG